MIYLLFLVLPIEKLNHKSVIVRRLAQQEIREKGIEILPEIEAAINNKTLPLETRKQLISAAISIKKSYYTLQLKLCKQGKTADLVGLSSFEKTLGLSPAIYYDVYKNHKRFIHQFFQEKNNKEFIFRGYFEQVRFYRPYEYTKVILFVWLTLETKSKAIAQQIINRYKGNDCTCYTCSNGRYVIKKFIDPYRPRLKKLTMAPVPDPNISR